MATIWLMFLRSGKRRKFAEVLGCVADYMEKPVKKKLLLKKF